MEQKQMMILLVLVIVIVVVVIAAVLMMGGGGQQAAPPTGTGAEPSGVTTPPSGGTTPPSGGTTPPSGGTTPPSGGTTPPSGGATIPSGVIDAMVAGSPVVCTVTMDMGKISGDPGMEGTVSTATMKMETPKMRMEGSSMGMTYTVINDGTNVYMKMPLLGDDWYMYTPDMGVEIPTADEVKQQMQEMPEGVTYDCQIVGDIPDSEFQLPPGIIPVDISEMMEGYEGMLEG